MDFEMVDRSVLECDVGSRLAGQDIGILKGERSGGHPLFATHCQFRHREDAIRYDLPDPNLCFVAERWSCGSEDLN